MASSPRTDILPVILGGDMSSYPLAREFHEAYGVKTICVVPAPIKIIASSRFIDVRQTDDIEPGTVLEAVRSIAGEHGDRRVILMVNSDAAVETAEQIAAELPSNVICPLPPHDAMKRASDKITFARMCDEYGLDAPHSQIIHLAGDDPVPPSTVPFPLIAKPAISSAEYVRLYGKGFKKIYFIHEQAELDALWSDLRAEGFSGDFLVQEFIGGDDTYVDMITVYMDQSGKATMFASAQVLLEDHNPALFGNPVAMLTRPMPELWAKVERMLAGIGWRGFANFDMKRDPETGRVLFMDFNPRIGCNSYYAVAGGVNPMRALVNDFIDGSDEVLKIDREALYTRAPVSLVRRYVASDALLAEYDRVVRDGLVFNPMQYPGDSIKSRLTGKLMTENYVRKFARFYPERTDTSF